MWNVQVEVADNDLPGLPDMMADVKDVLGHGGDVYTQKRPEYGMVVFMVKTDNVGLFSILEQAKKRKYILAMRIFNVLEKENKDVNKD